MMPIARGDEPLRQLFSALTEHAFQIDLGIADTRLIDYVSDLLFRFVRQDAIFRLRNTLGRRLDDLCGMLAEAAEREGKPRREIYRHIGDFTLFWSGVYPEALERQKRAQNRDHLLDYCERGKRSYFLASTFDEEPFQEEAPVLRRLSEEFELCTMGLRRVRSEWDRLPAESARRFPLLDNN